MALARLGFRSGLLCGRDSMEDSRLIMESVKIWYSKEAGIGGWGGEIVGIEDIWLIR